MSKQNEDKKEVTLEPIQHVLLHPITVDGKEVQTLVFQPLTFSIYESVDTNQDDQDQVIEDFALALTGMTQAEFDELKAPDFNSVEAIIRRLVTQNSPEWVSGLKISSECVQLAMPIKGDDGREIKELKLSVPSVKTRKLYKVQPTDEKKQAFITHSCTGLSELELGRLFMPDWNQLQSNIDNFLNKTLFLHFNV